MEEITVEAKPREDRGKNAARRLRRQGHVPAVLYGGKSGVSPSKAYMGITFDRY